MAIQPAGAPPPDLRPLDDYEGGPEMSLVDHLLELRNRVMISVLVTLIGVLVAFYFWEDIFGWLLAPARARVEGFKVSSFSPTDRIGVAFKISLYGGLILASPIVIYQFLAFVIPGLTPKERRMLWPGMVGISLFMLGGMAFAYWIILPASLGFLLTFGDENIESVTGAPQYMDFVIRIVFWVGVVFELPMVLAVLARFGVIRARQLISFWRYAIVLMGIVAAIVTPTPDALTMSLVIAPLLVLYCLGIGLAYLLQPKQPRVRAA
jgi:sec-independent protein translocase protein TatC